MSAADRATMIAQTYEDWTIVPRPGHSVRHWPTGRVGVVAEADDGTLLFRDADGEERCGPDELIVILVEDLGVVPTEARDGN